MARALVIGPNEQRAIERAIERARARPRSLEQIKDRHVNLAPGQTMKLSDRKGGRAALPRSEEVLIPFGYRACLTYEHQPVGLCKHLSIGVRKKGKLPNNEAIKMIAEAFGIDINAGVVGATWIEEYEPGAFAVNLVALAVPPQTGHA